MYDINIFKIRKEIKTLEASIPKEVITPEKTPITPITKTLPNTGSTEAG